MFVHWENNYGDDISVTRGNIHSYLGIDFDYPKKCTVQVAMIPYSKRIEDNFPEPITSTAPTHAADHLLQVRPDDEWQFLTEEQAQAFHRSTA